MMAPRDPIIDEAAESVLTGRMSNAEASKHFGVPKSSISTRVAIDRMERLAGLKDEPKDDEHVPPIFEDLHLPELDIWEAFNAIESTQEVVTKAAVGQHEARITVKTQEPIVVVPTSDWHLGSYATDHDSFQKHLRYVLSTPHLYLIDLGDNIDNFTQFKSAEAILGQALPPKVQKLLLAKILKTLVDNGKLLARCWSNHVEEFDERIFGGQNEAFNELCPYLRDDGRLFLKVGEVEYKFFVKHKFSGRSIYHVNHGNKRANRLDWPDADIVLSGDTHDGPEHDEYNYNGQPRLAMKASTFKTEDIRSRRYYGKVVPGIQGIVLFPDEKKFVGFRRVEDAISFRAVYAKESVASQVPT